MMRAVLTALKEVIVGCWRRWLGHVLSNGRWRLPRRLLAYDTLELGVKRLVGEYECHEGGWW